MVRRKILTDKAIQAAKPAPPGRRRDIDDGQVPGLKLRVTDKGSKSFVLITRYPGYDQPARRSLGEYHAVTFTLDKAREKGRQWLALVKRGIDPKQEEERIRLEQQEDQERKTKEEQRRQANSFAAVAEDYIADHVLKKRRGAKVARDIRRLAVATWGARPIESITRLDVRELVLRIKDKGGDPSNKKKEGAPEQARNVLSHLRTLFDWAIERGKYGLESSPCDRIKPSRLIGPKPAGQRTLDDSELRHVWKEAETFGYPFTPFVKLLLLTAQRRTEVAEARWAEFDLDRALWTIPGQRMKSGHAHLVPLATEAVEILNSLPRFGRGKFVFTATGDAKPIAGFSWLKNRIDTLAAEHIREPWTFHDLRRTARTHFSAIPVQEVVRELALAHSQQGLQKVYDLFKYQDEKRDLFEGWAKRLMAIVEPVPGKVLQFSAGQAR
jgi:integrase